MVAGCAGGEVVTGTGEAALDAYLQRGMTRGQAVPLAKRTAVLVAQRDLIERYAGTFLSSQTEIENFVARTDRIIATTGGLVKGVSVVRIQPSPDQTAYHVVVEANLEDLEETLGRGPEPKAALTHAIVWPKEMGGGEPAPADEPLRLEPRTQTITAKGVGVISKDLERRVALLKAARAAKTVAVRNLAERVYGMRLSSTTTVRDYVAERDEIQTRIDILVRGARVLDTVEKKEEGLVEVEIGVDAPRIEAALELP